MKGPAFRVSPAVSSSGALSLEDGGKLRVELQTQRTRAPPQKGGAQSRYPRNPGKTDSWDRQEAVGPSDGPQGFRA